MFPIEASKEAFEIIEQAQSNPHLKEPVVDLIKKHGPDAAAEAILLLVERIPQGGNTVFRPKSR